MIPGASLAENPQGPHGSKTPYHYFPASCGSPATGPIGGFSVIPAPRHHPPGIHFRQLGLPLPPPPPFSLLSGDLHNPEPDACLPLQRSPFSLLGGPLFNPAGSCLCLTLSESLLLPHSSNHGDGNCLIVCWTPWTTGLLLAQTNSGVSHTQHNA